MTKRTPRRPPSREAIRIGDLVVEPGRKGQIELPVARVFTGTEMSLPVVVVHGRRPGTMLWLDAAIHGDELNGIRIIRDVLRELDPRKLRGTVIAAPVVNVFGLIHNSRYLPDRRDLNRSFPGSKRGSLASRLARLFIDEVVEKCEIGLDLHTAGPSRTNLPHIRTDLSDETSGRLARAFGAPLIYKAPRIAGSLRDVCLEKGKRLLVYEAGEPLRFNDHAVGVGVAGVLRVLEALDMWDITDELRALLEPPAPEIFVGQGTRWLRAGRSGMFRSAVRPGEHVEKGQTVGDITDPFPHKGLKVKASSDGMVMGLTVNPLVHQGDALVHLVEVSPDGSTGSTMSPNGAPNGA